MNRSFQDEAEKLEALAHVTALSVMDGTSNEMERAVYLVVREKLRDHLVQEQRDASTTAPRGRLTPKELLTEAEKLLLRTGSGMSLLERLRRDGPLRAEL